MGAVHPDFFVVGAPKSATTALYTIFRKHPEVFLTKIKELHHFSWPEVDNNYYNAKIVKNRDEYEKLFSSCPDELVAGDFSPSYLYCEKSAERIFDYNPQARIIMILREPVSRAISHYKMDLRFGIHNSPMIDLIDNSEENRLYYKEYIHLGLYASQIRRFLDWFPREQVLILLYEEIRDSLEIQISRVCNHIGVSDDFNYAKGRRNLGFVPKNRTVGRLLSSNIATRISPMIPPLVSRKIIGLISKKGDLGIDEKIISVLTEKFVDDASLLSTEFGLDLGIWGATATSP